MPILKLAFITLLTWAVTNKPMAIKSTLQKIIYIYIFADFLDPDFMKIWRTKGEKNISKRKQTLKHKSTFTNVLATHGSHIHRVLQLRYLQHSGVREGTTTLWRQIRFFPNAVIGRKNIINKKTPTYFIHIQKGKHNDKMFRLKDSMWNKSKIY